ncbi:Aste57867_14891 [Aphanomyces stellatus]|uniref:Late endosomal/lysosomal adaptor and MAPK and MTOR activator 5 n=1 Tax=Aphanomyces stellatus TaxID=120398 RepID=A0A485L2R1_9STRA|nr:hypothetical protein As57867_014835 [Aphanomyces stellatus]VFT91707.1 Aste57867_14891 [Aphanomyces stellatus]
MSLNNVLESITSEDGASGVVWNDAQGLLLASHGDFQSARSGFGALNTLVAHAKALGNDDDDVVPVIRLETTKRVVLVQQQTDGTVLAVSTAKLSSVDAE